MIRRLTGTVADRDSLSIVLEVHGVGYRVFMARPTPAHTQNSTCTLMTYLAVRENALDLYGFDSEAELALFELLLTLPKIGPKSALQIMTQADNETIERAVRENDPSYLSKVSGIGKKTAEKIVVGLQDKLIENPVDTITNQTGHVADAIDALVALGYPASDARRVVNQLPATITNANDAIREALKLLGSS